MGSDNANLPKRLIKQGIAGSTLFAFLLAQLISPSPATAQDTLRQQPPPENKSGLEELTENLMGKEQFASTFGASPSELSAAPAAGLEEFSQKTLKGLIEQLSQGQGEKLAVERINEWIVQPFRRATSGQADRMRELRESLTTQGSAYLPPPDLALIYPDQFLELRPDIIPRFLAWMGKFESIDGPIYLQNFQNEAKLKIRTLRSIGLTYRRAAAIFSSLKDAGIPLAQFPSLTELLGDWGGLNETYHQELSEVFQGAEFVETLKNSTGTILGVEDIFKEALEQNRGSKEAEAPYLEDTPGLANC